MQLKSLLLTLCLSGCSALGLFSPTAPPPTIRPLQYLPGSSFSPDITNGLTDTDRYIYYHMDEGIQYLPTDVLLSLKRSDPTSMLKVMDEAFFAHPERFGLLPDYPNPNNPLPLGITSSTDPNYLHMAGIACPTCHTAMFSNDRNQFFLVDGAPSRFSIETFLSEMIKSLVGTLVNPVEFEAFYQRYQVRTLVDDQTPLHGDAQSAATMMSAALTSKDTTKLASVANTHARDNKHVMTSLQYDAYPTSAQLSTRTGMYFYLVRRFIWFFSMANYGSAAPNSNMAPAGFGRSDPWTPSKKMLVDKFLHLNTNIVKTATIVNTPYIWDLDRQHWIFLQGQTNSLVERNLIQALALWSDFNTTTYETTASIKSLNAIVQYAKHIRPPIWPESIFGPIDQTLAAQGKEIFRTQCLSCHDPKTNNTATASADYNYVNVDTDTTYLSTQIEGLDLGIYELFANVITPFMTKVKTTAMQTENISIIDMQNTYEAGRLPVVWKKPTSNAFVAKPLMGVWAKGYYLHNGSINSIYQLLLPATQRSNLFTVNSYVYDPKVLGYRTDNSLPDYSTVDVGCPKCEGNDNRGHEYGTDLSDPDRLALIEFLKSYTTDTAFVYNPNSLLR